MASVLIKPEEGIATVGDWSKGYVELVQESETLRGLVRAGQPEVARARMHERPVEEQAALVLVSGEDQEVMLSLTGTGRSVAQGYNPAVVDLLPSNALVGLIAVDSMYLKYNTQLVASLSADKFRELVEDTLDPVDNPEARRAISWAWLEAVSEVEVGKRVELLRSVDIELLAEALTEGVQRLDLQEVIGIGDIGVPRFRLFAELAMGGECPVDYIEDPQVAGVLFAVHEADPALLAEMVRLAWERAGEDYSDWEDDEDERFRN